MCARFCSCSASRPPWPSRRRPSATMAPPVACGPQCDNNGGWTGCTQMTVSHSGSAGPLAHIRHFLVVNYCKHYGIITSVSIAAHGCDTSGLVSCRIGPAWQTGGGVGFTSATFEAHATWTVTTTAVRHEQRHPHPDGAGGLDAAEVAHRDGDGLARARPRPQLRDSRRAALTYRRGRGASPHDRRRPAGASCDLPRRDRKCLPSARLRAADAVARRPSRICRATSFAPGHRSSRRRTVPSSVTDPRGPVATIGSSPRSSSLPQPTGAGSGLHCSAPCGPRRSGGAR